MQFYISPCPHGAFSSFAGNLYFTQAKLPVKFIPHATFLQIDPDQLDITKESNVFLCDYVGPSKKWVLSICSKANKVTLLDHHKTAVELVDELKKENMIPTNFEYILDMSRSGATVTYDYFSEQLKKPLADERCDST